MSILVINDASSQQIVDTYTNIENIQSFEIINSNCESLKGSFSAEHGVGRLKVKDLKQYCDPGKFDVMCQIKNAIDPLALLNPGVILRQHSQDT